MTGVWQPVELELTAATRDGNPYTDVNLTATFEHESGGAYEVPGFHDGGGAWRVRFAPPEPGHWEWETRTDTDDADLDGSGAFGASPDAGPGRLRQHGHLVADGRELRHADGEPFFWLGDTVWSAGAKATPGEWERYASARAEQGYTVAQINGLPQHDASLPQNRVPFVDWDLDRPNPAYFGALDAGVAALHDRGIVPALVALWYDYVAGENPDWSVATGERRPFDPERARRFGRYLGARYGAYGAVWLLSGDATFEEGTMAVYDALAEGIHEAVPDPLCTVHMPGSAVTPERVNERDWLDFHLYQSSHVSDLGLPAEQAERSRAMEPTRPVINGEPPYEGHGLFDGDTDRRVTRKLARQGAWISLLAGANAGVTYGGHGLWQWHRRGEENVQAARKGQPDPWDEALSLPGAADYARIRDFLKQFDYGALEPRQDLLAGGEANGEDGHLACAAELPADDAILVYLPRPGGVELADEVPAGRAAVWRHPGTLERVDTAVEGTSVAEPPFLDDALLVLR
jgi:hypothetical protein